MPIRIHSPSGLTLVDQAGFAAEVELQDVLAQTPDLLRETDEPRFAYVARELELPEAGALDLLFVTSDGLPIAVEVKLEANGQSRREVVAQAVDYLSSLTALTNDELDGLARGGLSAALRSFEPDTPDELFDRRWTSVGANLRAGLARVVVAVDAAPAGLERIVRFLADSSDLDIQLVAIERYSAPGTGEVVVPRFIVSASAQRRPSPSRSQEPKPELLAVVAAYNKAVERGLEAVGAAPHYRQVRPPEWPAGFRTHYEFNRTGKGVGAELHIEADAAKPLAQLLQPLAGVALAPGLPPLTWDQNWSSGRGRLFCRTAPDTDPEVTATAMRELITRTRTEVGNRLRQLVSNREDR